MTTPSPPHLKDALSMMHDMKIEGILRLAQGVSSSGVGSIREMVFISPTVNTRPSWNSFTKDNLVGRHSQRSSDSLEGGAFYFCVDKIINKTPTATRNLVSNMTSNPQQFGVKGSTTSRVVNEHHTSPSTRMCGICASIDHPIDECPTWQEIEPNNGKIATMMGGQQYRQPHDQYSNHKYEPTKRPTIDSQRSSTFLQTTTTYLAK
ncbi:hypothetical protein CR513_39610, partial [Mucuna pruriens]